MQDDKQEKINDALLKVALGGSIAEVTEEYAEVDGELKLTKRKKTKRDVPPDLKALQLLIVDSGKDYAAMSDEELEAEKLRLFDELQKMKRENAQTAKTAVRKIAAKRTAKTAAKKSVGAKRSTVTAAKPQKKEVAVSAKKKGAGI